jgi:Pin2-interacting protein X1
MASQGWKPGEYLGAKDAPHAEFHTAANATHIRVTIKDDNLGLGAKIGSGVGHGECTGLDAFKNLLGRLNGKDEEEIEKEQKSREDLKRAIYTERRWGSIRFVQGGFLVGDKIQDLIDGEAERIRKLAATDAGSGSDSSDLSDSSDSDEEPAPVAEEPKKSKKRKLEEREEAPEVVAAKVKKSKKRKSEVSLEGAAEIAAAMEAVKMSEKKRRRKCGAGAEVEGGEKVTEPEKRKKEKWDRKDKKDTKERSKSRQKEEPAKDSKKKSKQDKKKGDLESSSESSESRRLTTKENTPSTPLELDSGRSTPIMQGRHAVRARNIAQKRLASMDVASLNQVSLPF